MTTLRALAPPIGLMIVILLLSSVSGPTEDQQNFLGLLPPTLQNLLHVPLFGALTWLWVRGLQKIGQPPGRALVLAALISMVWGVLDEFHQFFVPGRYASVTDIALNSGGVLLGIVLFRIFSGRADDGTRDTSAN